MANRMYEILNGHFKKAVSEPEQYVIFSRHTDSINKFYIMIRNISGPYNMFESGEFLFEMETPPDFPHKPPKFKALTPNGVYKLGEPCCISIGHFHPQSYRAVSGIREFPIELANGFIGCTCECKKKCDCTTLDKSGGINLEQHPIEFRKKLALASKQYNLKHNKEVLENMELQYAEYSKKWEEHLSKMQPAERFRLNFRDVIFEKAIITESNTPKTSEVRNPSEIKPLNEIKPLEEIKPLNEIKPTEIKPTEIKPDTLKKPAEQKPPPKKKITIKLKKN